ncbi:CDP-alcohol phosphatidyltransferase family protein [Aminobacter sp. MET-1]|uniref:CDP-alcohol phosphatidyltransferase family protein n=1 Tax=Aminobacter sp. MET-1 TaxID=2951085 RepID=UPI00226A89C9|nr:CDP-alcohol phosphatidyltransferase family protein [Aminobacter sp. MET-1]MCX8569431.1 CDP-alcohol phosphatidyltransferase family protein [Aminobacter sp. MET-1]
MTIPNMITIMRLVLVPCVIYAMISGSWNWAFAGFVVAGVSDAVDGFIARQFNQHSKLGAYLDPMADKLLLVSVFVVLGIMGHLPLWLVILVVSRDALIVCAVLLSTVMGNPVVVKPLMVSKINTAVQIVLAAIVLAQLSFEFGLGLLLPALITVSGLLTVASAAAYLVAWLRHMSGYGEGETPDR